MRAYPLALVLAAAGCTAAGDGELRDALPRIEALTIGVPAGSLEKPAVGDPSPLYLVARRTSERLNAMIVHTVGTIAAVAAGEPAYGAENRAVWGPITSALSPVVYRLVAEGGPDGVAYHLDGWPRSGGEAVVIVAGQATHDGRAGRLRVELDRLRALDPAVEVGPGALDLAYDGTSLALRLGEAHYAYAGRPGGAGRFVFASEDGAVHAGWRGDGAGRAAVGADGLGVVECWDTSFRRVFFAGPDGSEGDAAACADVP